MLPTTPPNLTAQGAILGTFQYMAPEQIEGLEADARTDIFAFGELLFEMLIGRPPFEGKTRASLLGSILKDDPPRVSTAAPGVPPLLDRVVSTCLCLHRDRRKRAERLRSAVSRRRRQISRIQGWRESSLVARGRQGAVLPRRGLDNDGRAHRRLHPVRGGGPKALFLSGIQRLNTGRLYGATKDGKRFIVARRRQVSTAAPLTVVLDWPASVQR
jgi:serine/threonine protein kinase